MARERRLPRESPSEERHERKDAFSPLPLGEGRGEGEIADDSRSVTKANSGLPSPQPSPRGRGGKRSSSAESFSSPRAFSPPYITTAASRRSLFSKKSCSSNSHSPFSALLLPSVSSRQSWA